MALWDMSRDFLLKVVKIQHSPYISSQHVAVDVLPFERVKDIHLHSSNVGVVHSPCQMLLIFR